MFGEFLEIPEKPRKIPENPRKFTNLAKIWGRGRGGDSKNIIGEFQGLSPKILELRGGDGDKIKYNLSSLVSNFALIMYI